MRDLTDQYGVDAMLILGQLEGLRHIPEHLALMNPELMPCDM